MKRKKKDCTASFTSERRMCGRTLSLLVCLLALVGCQTPQKTREPTDVDGFYGGDLDMFLGHQAQQAASESRSRALAQVNCASAALCKHDFSSAQKFLELASATMWSFSAEGETEALRVKEEPKIYKGDPYEKAMASFYLGMIDYMNGHFENTVASCKTAILADSGSKTNLFDSDFTPAFFLQACALRALGQTESAKDGFQFTKGILLKRTTASVVRQAIISAVYQLRDSCPSNEKQDLLNAVELYFNALGISKPSLAPPGEVFDELSQTVATQIADLRKSSGSPSISWETVARWSSRLTHECKRLLASSNADEFRTLSTFLVATFDSLSATNSNVLIIVDLGRGPRKFSAGGRNQQIKVIRGIYAARAARIQVGNLVADTFRLEDVWFQANTRGGREMDSILQGKATFKDLTEAGGALAATASIYTLPLALLLWAAEASVNATADTRCWECLPGEVHVAALTLQPGEYDVNVSFLDALGRPLFLSKISGRKCTVLATRPTLWYLRSVGGNLSL